MAVIPLSFLMTAIGMNALKVSGNLMSLGALDFGLIVDGSVIIIENCLRRLAERQHHEGRLLDTRERVEETTLATQEMIRPTVYGQAIIFLVFAPLLTFTGVEGKTFSPMAITLMLALAAAFILSVTLVPALVALLIRGKLSEKDVAIVRAVKRWYAPVLDRTVARPWPFVAAADRHLRARRADLHTARQRVHAATRRRRHRARVDPAALDANSRVRSKCSAVSNANCSSCPRWR